MSQDRVDFGALGLLVVFELAVLVVLACIQRPPPPGQPLVFVEAACIRGAAQ